jgi:hypothetical protein
MGETARFHVRPGEVLLGVRYDLMGRGLCALHEGVTQRETVLRPGETKHYLLSIDASGNTDVQRGSAPQE